MGRLGRCAQIVADDLSESFVQFSDECSVIFPKIKREIDMVPDKVFEKSVDIMRDIRQNWEAGSILVLASIGSAFLIGKFTMGAALPAFIERKMVAPVLGALAVRGIAFSAERRRR